MSRNNYWTLIHKKYAIMRLGQYVSYALVLKELKDPLIGKRYGFTPLPPEYNYVSFWGRLQNEKVQNKISKAKDKYRRMLEKTLPITNDQIKFEELQKIIDDPNSTDKDKMHAIELTHKIQQTKNWQDSAKASNITVQMIENIIASEDVKDE